MKYFAVPFVLSLMCGCLLGGCTSVLSEKVLHDSEPRLAFQEIRQFPKKYKGRMVVFGGTLIQKETGKEGTWVEVLQRPLDWRLKPYLDDRSDGRFLVKTDQLLEPEEFTKNRLITVAGIIAAPETRKLGSMEYHYPVLQLEEYQLWSEQRSRPNIFLSIGISGSF